MLNYRIADLTDIDQLHQLEQSIIDAERPFNPSIKSQPTRYYDLQDLLSSSESQVIVADDLGHIVGTGYAQVRVSKASLEHDYHAYLGFMFVLPEYRGKGVNRRIIDTLIVWSKSRGMNDVYLDVYSQNIGAVKAYEKSGFRPSTIEMKLSLS